MQHGPGLPPVFHQVKFWMRLGAVVFFAVGAILAGPTLWAQFVTHDRLGVEVVAISGAGHPVVAVPAGGGSFRRVALPALDGARVGDHVEVFRARDDPSDIRVYDVDRAYVILVICVGIALFAISTGDRIVDADKLCRADVMAQAGVGEQFIVESRDFTGATSLLRVMSAERVPPPTTLNRLQDETVDSLGGSGVAIGVTVFTWLFFVFLALGFDGVFQGTSPSLGGILAIVVVTAGALAIATFRSRTVLSNRDRAIHRDVACLGMRRRRSEPLDPYDAVAMFHQFVRTTSSTGNRHATRWVDRFTVVLCGPEEMRLESFPAPVRARRRARQLANYLGLPLREPDVDDPAAVKLFKG